MSAMSNHLEKKLLDHTLGLASWTMPAETFVALFTADPGETGSLAAEISFTSTGYARQSATTAMGPTNATTGISLNEDVITFGPATVDWGTVTHMAIMDAATGGNVLLYGALTSSRNIQTGDSFQFAASQLSITFA
ncbi:MAG TPA: hypothetical protein VGO06_13670 [Bosea sp. (in: a-proteobacteria)]|jgi:hypothetical protein|uniref:phage tail fiber protein n=1 Tax=Bosea sp. (in: a-proteobacteria) TaxID=1871050 RepID=UPI002E1128D0|nr:hypothetical protein [Bosea sp. (in: a-proteobacteria)]